MPEKPKARSWKEVQTAIAAISMLLLLAISNRLADYDRRRAEGKMDATISTPESKGILGKRVILAAVCPPSETNCVTRTRSS